MYFFRHCKTVWNEKLFQSKNFSIRNAYSMPSKNFVYHKQNIDMDFFRYFKTVWNKKKWSSLKISPSEMHTAYPLKILYIRRSIFIHYNILRHYEMKKIFQSENSSIRNAYSILSKNFVHLDFEHVNSSGVPGIKPRSCLVSKKMSASGAVWAR